MKQIHNDCISTEETLEVVVAIHRGFGIGEFIHVVKVFYVDPDYCPDPDTYHLGTPGTWKLIVERLYRAVRIKTGQGTWGIRGRSIDEVKEQIDNNLGYVRNPIPF